MKPKCILSERILTFIQLARRVRTVTATYNPLELCYSFCFFFSFLDTNEWNMIVWLKVWYSALWIIVFCRIFSHSSGVSVHVSSSCCEMKFQGLIIYMITEMSGGLAAHLKARAATERKKYPAAAPASVNKLQGNSFVLELRHDSIWVTSVCVCVCVISVTRTAAPHKHPSLNLRPADSVSHPVSYRVMSCLFRAAPLFLISSLTLANASSNIKV